jgi:membrane-bound lytic murein transglycosylase D
MKKILSFFLLLTPALCVFCTSCAAHRTALNAPKLIVMVSTPAVGITEVPLDKPDSSGIFEEPSKNDIDSLIEIAQLACNNADYEGAHIFLQEAVQSIKDNEDNLGDNETEDYYKKIANCYMESMPTDYEDSIPDEISLLTFRKQLAQSLDVTKFSTSDSIMWQKNVAQEKADFNIPIVWNDRVYRALYFLNRGGKGPLGKWMARAAYYMPTIKKMFVDSAMPTDLAYLPLIESGFNPLAYSRMRASGMWQFMLSTGTRYGLRTDCWVDERRDFIKSTRAAICYFKKLYDQFSDWHLAIGSYNCGENGMSCALSRSRVKDFWSLSLPRETMHYVPEFIATLIAAKNPNYPDSGNTQAIDTFNLDTVTVKECLSLYAIADTLHVPASDLRRMNPHILHWCTHPRLPITLYLPSGTKERFLISYDQSPLDFIVAWYNYKVKPGDNFFNVSRRFKIPMEALLSLNSRTSSQRLSVGQELKIPIPTNQGPYRSTAIRVKNEPVKASYKTVVIGNAKVIKYRVRPGDCLSGLARLFHVDKSDLCGWNNIADATSLRSGMVLSIYKSSGMHGVIRRSGSSVARTPEEAAKFNQKTLATSAAQKPVGFIADASSKRIVYYRIRKGDNLWNIAQSFRVAIRQLTSINDITPDTALLPGKIIKVPLLEEL